MRLPFIKFFPNSTWVLMIMIIKENYEVTAGFKNDNDGNFMLVETPDNEKSQHAKYLLVNKENDIKSLIKIDSNKDYLESKKPGKLCEVNKYPNVCPKGFICKQIIYSKKPGFCVKTKECKKREDCIQYCSSWGSPVCGGGTVGFCYCAQRGRPFIVNGRSYTTISRGDMVNDSELEKSWANKTFEASFPNTSYDQEIGLRWIESAEAEHASIASFARHTLQLLSLNVPANLLISSQEAAIDEVRHTETSYGVANAFLKTTIKPDVLDIQQGLDQLSSDDIIKSIIQEGCIEETISAIQVNMAANLASHPLLKKSMLQIANEEANHAQLAWSTIQWLNEKHSGIKNLVEKTFQSEFKHFEDVESERSNIIDTPRCEDETRENILHNFGVLGNDNAMTARKIGLGEIRKLGLPQSFQTASLIADKIMNVKFA